MRFQTQPARARVIRQIQHVNVKLLSETIYDPRARLENVRFLKSLAYIN